MECYAEALVLLLKRANAMFSVLVLFKLNNEHYLASDVSLWDESPCNSKNRQESDYFSIFYCFGALDLFVFVP